MLALLVFAASLSGSASADPPVLNASVGPGFTISLDDSTGALVKHLDPGEYIVNVNDQSDMHNFDLTGPGVNKKTGIAFTGTVTWTVTLKAGTYTFRSDAHKALKGTLKVH